MADARRFPLVNVERDGKPIQAMAIECRKCGVGARYLITNSGKFSNAMAVKYFRVHGWEVGKSARGDICPDCAQRHKPQPKVIDMSNEAAAPREMTREDRRTGKLVPLFARQTLDVRQSISAVYYRNTALASRIACFVEYVTGALGQRPFDE